MRLIPATRKPEYAWTAREVVRDLDGRPHLLLRVTLRGAYFPHRAAEPFLLVTNGEETTRCLFAETAADNASVAAYFPADVPRGGLEFGYNLDPDLVPVGTLDPLEAERLDRDRVEKGTQVVTMAFMAERWGREQGRPGGAEDAQRRRPS